MLLPKRQALPHETPLWVRSEEAVYFLTICCQPRGQNQLAHPHIASAIFETVAFRNEQNVWYCEFFLLMPDHAHALIAFPTGTKLIKTIVASWKEWTAKQTGVAWQRDFFDHRLRRDESLKDKADYIYLNPVRAGLVEKPEDWPYVWFPER